jgi:hypothetical protein
MRVDVHTMHAGRGSKTNINYGRVDGFAYARTLSVITPNAYFEGIMNLD